jgi:hypothetical protein
MYYNPNPSDPNSAWGDYKVGGSPLGDFRLNPNVAGDQNDSYVAMGPSGDFTAVWVGPNPNDLTSGLDIWARSVAVSPQAGTLKFQAPIVSKTSTSPTSASGASDSTSSAALALTGQGTTFNLTDSALGGTTNGYNDPAEWMYPAPDLGLVDLTGSTGVTSGATTDGTATSSLYDSALIDLLGLEGSQSGLTALDPMLGMPASDLGSINP